MSQLPHPDDTIAALASAAGGAARGIVRVSGQNAVQCLGGWFVPQLSSAQSADAASATAPPFDSKVASCSAGTLSIAGLRQPLPVDLYLWPSRRSYTGEPLAELHTIGSPPLLEAVLAELFTRGVRPAQPGEFTLRAFLAGRIDLMQAEAVLGVIDARNRAELQQALEQLGGGVSSQVVRLRGDLLDLLADLEAGLDFAEEDIEFVSHATLVGRIGLARDAVTDLMQRAASRLRSAARPRVVLAGPPNAGKSTLFNALVGAEAAIVSDERGTTRDYLAADVSVDTVTFTLVDTAGSETAADSISSAAQQLRLEQLSRADVVVWCHPADSSEESLVEIAELPLPRERLLVAITKSDLPLKAFFLSLPPGFKGQESGVGGESPGVRLPDPTSTSLSPPSLLPNSPSSHIPVSAHTRAGLDGFKSAIASRLTDPTSDRQALLGTTAARCQESLQGALQALDRALNIARDDADQELLAIELRETLDELGKIVGAVYTDDILDRIFSKFCIGK